MSKTTYQRISAASPEAVLDAAERELMAAGGGERWLAVGFRLRQYWLEGEPEQSLIALYHLQATTSGCRTALAVFEPEPRVVEAIAQAEPWFSLLGVRGVALAEPVELAPVRIPKPWGQEIWYTGVERRGQAAVTDGAYRMPLPWLLAAAPRRVADGQSRDLILLKILDPLPDPVFGDLYFELHEEKREVYVVTAVDRRAWPDGVGGIRFGFDAGRVAQYPSEQAFLDAYLASVAKYREVRRAIDELLDQRRLAAGVGLNEPLAASTLRQWLAGLPAELTEREQHLREAMESFTALRPLQVGDVVKVPHRVPHSLQHGVRTVEFQTPVYERLILSFAQKVLTQADWDTAAAARIMTAAPPAEEAFEQTASGRGWLEERIVEFDDFEVHRVRLEPGASRLLDATPAYALLMCVGGDLQLDGKTLGADVAVLLPAAWNGGTLRNTAAEPRVALLATPVHAR
ncbi:MAG: hypothetical protein RBS88_08470 [Spongiibacteraceae bacterium]|jgi:hypothetical protein|nr:hypothetical protein [Spongiibacteraceae bacterium]